MKHYIALLLSFALNAGTVIADAASDVPPARENVIALSGVKGGLIVVIGCPSSSSLQATFEHMLRAAEGPYAIQVLDTAGDRIHEAREAIRARHAYGKVSAIIFTGSSCRTSTAS